jgi:hypothetical protein
LTARRDAGARRDGEMWAAWDGGPDTARPCFGSLFAAKTCMSSTFECPVRQRMVRGQGVEDRLRWSSEMAYG